MLLFETSTKYWRRRFVPLKAFPHRPASENPAPTQALAFGIDLAKAIGIEEKNMIGQWERLTSSQRLSDGHVTADLWRIGGGIWRWTLMDEESGVYLLTGDAHSEREAKHQVSEALAGRAR